MKRREVFKYFAGIPLALFGVGGAVESCTEIQTRTTSNPPRTGFYRWQEQGFSVLDTRRIVDNTTSNLLSKGFVNGKADAILRAIGGTDTQAARDALISLTGAITAPLEQNVLDKACVEKANWPCFYGEGDMITVYSSFDMQLRYARDLRWDMVGHTIQMMEADIVRRIQDRKIRKITHFELCDDATMFKRGRFGMICFVEGLV